MGYRIRPGYEVSIGTFRVEVPTMDDAVSLLEAYRARHPEMMLGFEKARIRHLGDGGSMLEYVPDLPTTQADPVETRRNTMQKFFDRIIAQPILRAEIVELAKAPNGLSDVQLRTQLHLSTNQQLAARHTAFGKNAKQVGLTLKDVLDTLRIPGNGDPRYLYRLTSVMREVVERNIPEEERQNREPECHL